MVSEHGSRLLCMDLKTRTLEFEVHIGGLRKNSASPLDEEENFASDAHTHTHTTTTTTAPTTTPTTGIPPPPRQTPRGGELSLIRVSFSLSGTYPNVLALELLPSSKRIEMSFLTDPGGA